MSKYHLDENLEPAICRAKEQCPKGGPHIECEGIDEARRWASGEAAKAMASLGWASLSKSPKGFEEKTASRYRKLGEDALLKMAQSGLCPTERQLAKAFPHASVRATEWLHRTLKGREMRPADAFRAFMLGTWKKS